MDISTLVPSQSPIDDAHTKSSLYTDMCDAWGLEPRDPSHNPCPMAVTLEAHHLELHEARNYLVVPKTDGIRYLLLLTVTEQKPHAVMIGRDMRMYEVEVWAPLSFFERRTLLDGELAWTREGTMSYFAFDAMMIDGIRIVKKSLVERLHAVRQALELTEGHQDALTNYSLTMEDGCVDFVVEEKKIVATPNNNYALCLVPKAMLSVEDWATGEQWSVRGEPSTASDGLVFTPMHLPVFVNTHASMFKWKPMEQLTVDFLCRSNVLHLVKNGEVAEIDSILDVPLVLSESDIDDGVFECTLTLAAGTIRATPDRRRTDKRRPNSVATAEATVRSIQNFVDESMLRKWARGNYRSSPPS